MPPKLINVNKRTRAGQNGRYIVCPHCEGALRVYNFAWSSLECMYCKRPAKKETWYTLA